MIDWQPIETAPEREAVLIACDEGLIEAQPVRDPKGCRAMNWIRSHRADPIARQLADRHYNRQKIGSPQFVPPGRCLVLRTAAGDAVWVTSWPLAAYVKHAWAGAWVNSLFRNESPHLSSTLIRQAVAYTRGHWSEVPTRGMVTFVNADKVRRKRDPGRCYRKANFQPVGFTKGGLWALQLLETDMPKPYAGAVPLTLFDKAAP